MIIKGIPFEKLIALIDQKTEREIAEFEDQIRSKALSFYGYLGLEVLNELEHRSQLAMIRYLDSLRVKAGKTGGHYEDIDSIIRSVISAPFVDQTQKKHHLADIRGVENIINSMMLVTFLNLSRLDDDSYKNIERKFEEDTNASLSLTSKNFQRYFLSLLAESEEINFEEQINQKIIN